MKKWLAVLLIVLACPMSALGAPTVDYGRSQITFSGKQMGVPTEGRFRKYSVRIAFDAKKLEAARIDAEIDLASIDTGASETDTEVKKPTWFNIAAFPTAKFNAVSIKQISPGTYQAAGKLS